jgi:serine/threonine protein kinase
VYKKVILDIVGNGTLFLTVQGDTSAIRIPAGLTSAAIKLKVCVKPKLTPEMLKHGSFDVALQKGEGTNPGGGLVLSTATLELVPKTPCKTFTVQASTADDFYIDYKLDEDQMRHLRPIHPLLRTQLRAIGHVTTPASSKVFVAGGQKSAFLTIALSAPVAKDNTFILRLLLDPKGVQIAGNVDSSFEIVFGDEEAEKNKVSNKDNGEEENGNENSLPPPMRNNHPNPSQQIQFLGIQPGTWVIKYELLDGYSNDHFTCAKNITVIVTPGPSPSPKTWRPVTIGLAVAAMLMVGAFALICFSLHVQKDRRRRRDNSDEERLLSKDNMRESGRSESEGRVNRRPQEQQSSSLKQSRLSDFTIGEIDQVDLLGGVTGFDRGEASTWFIDLKELELKEEVGVGASAQVFRGVYFGQQVAVKRLFCSVWEQHKFTEFFRSEAQLLASLHHPNVVRFYGAAFDANDNRGYLVTEYCSKGSLSEHLQNHTDEVCPREKKFLPLVTGISRGMQFFHAKQFVHRDLKPDNVLLDEGSVIKLCDFGLSRFVENSIANTMTAGIGTPAFMAIELIIGEDRNVEAGTKIDVFSFGVMLWVLWTHRIPYVDLRLTPFTLMNKVVNGLRPIIPDDCPRNFEDLMERCWARDPADRPQFSECTIFLEEAMAGYRATGVLGGDWDGVVPEEEHEGAAEEEHARKEAAAATTVAEQEQEVKVKAREARASASAVVAGERGQSALQDGDDGGAGGGGRKTPGGTRRKKGGGRRRYPADDDSCR